MSGFLAKLRKIFSADSPPREEENEESIDFDKYYYPEIIGKSHILSNGEIEFIDRHLPQRMVGVKWVLKYSTETDGYSLATLYRKLKDWEDRPVLLVLEDDCRYKFGAFGTESFKPDYKVRGTFECFVFRLKHDKFHREYGTAVQGVREDGVIRKSSQESTGSNVSSISFEVVNSPPSGSCIGDTKEIPELSGRTCPDGDVDLVRVDGVVRKSSQESTNSAISSMGYEVVNPLQSGNCIGDSEGSREPDCRPCSTNGKTDSIKNNEEGAGDVVNDSESGRPIVDDPSNWMQGFDFSENKVWTWTNLRSSVFIHGELDYLRIGMHDGATALWIDGSLRFGGSDNCKIFNNERLAPNPNKKSSDNTFRILKVEVWGFRQ